MPVYDETLTDGIGTAQTDNVGCVTLLTDGIGTAQTQVVGWATSLTDDIGASALIDAIRGVAASASDTMSLAPSIIGSYGMVVLEQLRIDQTDVANHTAQISLSDISYIAERLLPGIPVTLAETITLAFTQLTQQSIAVIEQLQLAPTVAATMVYQQSAADTIGVAVSLANFFGASISDQVNIAELLAGYGVKGATLSETVNIAEATTPALVIRVTAEDTIDISATQALRMVFNPVLADGVEIAAAYLSPGDSVVTWAMNTRTGAVTEYSNFAFNSFARNGNKYLAASSTGLYELLGDTDAGTNIIAQIKSGFAQWTGSRFTMFKAAYLGVRGTGDFVLKIVTGDDKTYNYAVSARDMRSTRVNVGKGLRARYFAFELISTGQDFDLESVEFVPIAGDRRV